jgi:hypothetical protein
MPTVQIRLMADDPEAVELAADHLYALLGPAGFTVTGQVPNRSGGGLRIYASITVPDPRACFGMITHVRRSGRGYDPMRRLHTRR